MKVPKSYEGLFVCVQLAAPVYMFGYGAHVKIKGEQHVMPAPIIKADASGKQSSAMTNLLTGVRVVTVHEDSVVFELYDFEDAATTGTIMTKLVPEQLILSIDRVASVDAALPEVTVHTRAKAQSPSIVMP